MYHKTEKADHRISHEHFPDFTDNYQFIHGSIFEVARMVERRPDKVFNGYVSVNLAGI